MRQIFLLILLFIVGNWLVKALRRADSRTSSSNPSSTSSSTSSRPGTSAPGAGTTGAAGGERPSAAAQLAEPMIRCAECGVHAPQGDSVVVAGQPFCSADHAKRHTARQAGRDAR